MHPISNQLFVAYGANWATSWRLSPTIRRALYDLDVSLVLILYDCVCRSEMNKTRKGNYLGDNVVPVLDANKKPLMPCSEKRARLLMERGQAKAYYQKSIFCIMLLKEPSDRRFQDIALGIDPGSKREGYSVLTKKNVVLNVLTNTPYWVKDHVEARRVLRRLRRSRKTPYRACRENRSCLHKPGRLPPSTHARWNAKLRITKQLLRILPITHINVEDVSAMTKKGKRKWNASFSPLEVGKAWFYDEVGKLGSLALTQGFNTKAHRDQRGFTKTKSKLEDVWEAHNVDSHALAEIVLSSEVLPFKGMYRIDFLEYHRRQLHMQNPAKGGVRKLYGGTVSLGMSRGSILRHKEKGLVYLGGTSNGRVSTHDIATGKRIDQHCKTSDIEIMHTTKERTQFLRQHKAGGILAKKDNE